MRAVMSWRLGAVLLGLLPWTTLPAATPPAEQAPAIFEVSSGPVSFNPSQGDAVDLNYHLSTPARVTVKVYDPDFQQVRALVEAAPRDAGPHAEPWDGKDDGGIVVPDEAYFFTIKAVAADGRQAVYDPITFSGGEPGDLTDARFDRRSGTLSYRLSQPSRVLIRIGITGSALLKTVVDWRPRIDGRITEYWDGRDEDDLIDLWDKNYSTLITYYTLPETSVIAFGNPAGDYLSYKAGLGEPRPPKPDRPQATRRRLSPNFLTPRILDRAFPVHLSFPQLADSGDPHPQVDGDRLLVRLEVDEVDRKLLLDQQYEIIVFVDTVFFAEEEKGYLPFNFPLEVRQLPPGEHVLTVNIATFNGQIGVGSRTFRVAP